MLRKIIFATVCLAVVFVFAGNADAQAGKRAVRNATWQTSVNDDDPGKIQLGVRDKWESLGRYNVQFVVTKGKRVFRARAVGTRDDFVYVVFPNEFGSAAAPEGAYSVAFYVNGVLIGRDKFNLFK